MKTKLILGFLAALGSVSRVAAADWPPTPELQIYGTLVPFTEYAWTQDPSKRGFTGGADQVAPGAYTGAHDRPRFRMTAGTSNLGFKGGLQLIERYLRIIWQIESAVPIDGNGPPNTIASRNSHIGLSGDWGSLIFGIWDTPYKWALLTSVNPMEAGYVADYTPIIGTPGFGVGSLNTASGYSSTSPASNAAFTRREANSIQYWSPTLAGFNVRLSYTLNEGRNSQNQGPMMSYAPGINPWLTSGWISWTGAGFLIRYALEYHHDYFGMSALGGSPGPSVNVTTSSDMGNEALVQYTTPFQDLKTRIIVVGELLSYQNTDTNQAAINKYSRPAFYGLIEQSIFKNHVWVAYGQALEGKCERVNGTACSTNYLDAKYASLGYMYAFTPKTNIHLIGYRVFNNSSARYATFPALSPIAPGADQVGIGIGLFHAFNFAILGDKDKSKEPTPAPAKPAAVETAPSSPTPVEPTSAEPKPEETEKK